MIGDELGELDAVMPEAQDSRVPARFFVEPVRDEAKSQEKGRAIFVDAEMIEIRIGKDVLRRQVTDDDKRNYARQYDAFTLGLSQEKVQGTPLTEWPPMTRGEEESLKAAGINSVEQFAAAPDSTLQQIGPFMAKRQLAVEWIKKAEDGARLSQLRGENDELRKRIATLEQMVQRQAQDIDAARANGGTLAPAPAAVNQAELAAQVAAAVEAALAAKPKRGRKPKANGTPET